ncbi:MAG: HAMP domain-containing protein [Deltaproteobacteria bacterium]|uniref:histidine kinase n=1 Tax=Candidatus Zymogenus saltonus TaxID=2844893 RepID=A0A9D8KGS8_9DELT|nr:HAMP domain-containing protein [Candidatus Zymogenus saltonus]
MKSQLESVAILKEQEIRNWMDHLKHTVIWLAENRETIYDANSMKVNTVGSPEYLRGRDSLVSEFRRIKDIGHFSSILFLDGKSGKIMASSDAFWEEQFKENEQYFIKGREGTYVSDIYFSLTLGKPTMVISAPVKDNNGKLLGVLVYHANLEYLSEIMLERSGLGDTGETFLVNSSNLLITNTVFEPEGAFKKWIFGQGAKWALEGKNGVGLFMDYREEPVIGAYRWLGDLRLALIAKQDQSEAFDSINNLGFTLLGIGLDILLIVIVLSILFSRTITRPIYKLVKSTEMVGSGNLDYRVGTLAKDEIGELSRSFDKMTMNLKEITVSRNELVREIAERKQIEKALIESEERYRELFERINSGVAVYEAVDNGGDFIFKGFNKAGERIDRLDRKDLIEKRLTQVFPGVKEFGLFEVLQRVWRTGKEEFFPSALYKDEREPGGWRENWVYKLPTGEIVAVYDDITERKLAENKLKDYSERLEEMVEERTKELKDTQEQLVRREKLAFLGQLSGSVSHELRNPLGVISNAVYYLQTVLNNTDENTKEYLDIILLEVKNSERIISDLLDFSRTKSPERENTDVSEMVNNALLRHSPPDGVIVTTDINKDIPPVFVDSRQIGQVLDNLITNAYQAMPEGGELKIEAKAVKKKVNLSVTDTGLGISKENIKKLFEPLFTTRARGIGLGLSVSKSLMEANEGDIKVKSEEGGGSTFTIGLPIR